jgi:hypothetical protein
MRVTASVTGRLARVAPDEVLKYGDWAIPPGTPISMDHHFTHLDPVLFPEPKKFNPDRWRIAAEMGESYERYFLPFGRGSRMCIGMKYEAPLAPSHDGPRFGAKTLTRMEALQKLSSIGWWQRLFGVTTLSCSIRLGRTLTSFGIT